MPRLRLLTYNIHKGFSSGNRHLRLTPIRTAIRATGADIVCLQEVLGRHDKHSQTHPDWHPGGQFEYLADELWPHYAYGKNAIYQQGHHGNATLSRYPFSHWQNIDISRWQFSRRGILLGRIGEHLYVLCVHFGFLPWEQNFQLECLQAVIHEHVPATAPLLIAGDFNDWHLRIHRQLTRQLGLQEASSQGRRMPALTYPASQPRLPLDRIYYRNLHLLEARRLQDAQWASLSDHCPLLADFQVDWPLTSDPIPHPLHDR